MNALDGLGLVGETLKEGGENAASRAVDESRLNGRTGTLLEESGDRGKSGLLDGDVLLVGKGLVAQRKKWSAQTLRSPEGRPSRAAPLPEVATERRRPSSSRRHAERKAAYLDERSSKADLLDEVGAAVLGLRGKSLSGSTVLSEEGADIEGRHLQEQSGTGRTSGRCRVRTTC